MVSFKAASRRRYYPSGSIGLGPLLQSGAESDIEIVRQPQEADLHGFRSGLRLFSVTLEATSRGFRWIGGTSVRLGQV